MKQTLLLLISIFIANQLIAQEDVQTQSKGFVIVAAGKNYDAMKKMASKVAQKTGYKLNLRDLEYSSQIGLSFSQKDCENNGFEFPAYIARGRYDDGEYISIEYTDGFEGFTPGLYIIIASSHDKGSSDLKKALTQVKKYYKSAYIKYTDVYMGCIH